MKNSACIRFVLVLVVCVLAGAVTARAQDAAPKSDDLALAVANAQKANQAALTKYSWKVKSDLAKDGSTMATAVSEMRFNTEGKLESTNISSQTNVEKKPGFRGRQQEQAMQDFAKYLESVLDQSFKYIFMSKGTLVDVFDRATIIPADGSTNVAAGDLFVKGDKLNLSVDAATNLANKLTFTTTLDQDTITGVVTFARMENGPGKPTRLQIEVPAKALKITAETFDWIEQK